MDRIMLAFVGYSVLVGNNSLKDGIISILLYVYTGIYLPNALLMNFYVISSIFADLDNNQIIWYTFLYNSVTMLVG